MPLGRWVFDLSRRDPTPAGGALALTTLAGAAALAAKVVRLTGGDPSPLESLSQTFLAGAGTDGEAYVSACRGGGKKKVACLELGLTQLADAVSLLEDIALCFGGVSAALSADLTASARLAGASAHALLVNLAVNASAWSGIPDTESVVAQLQALKNRLEAAEGREACSPRAIRRRPSSAASSAKQRP